METRTVVLSYCTGHLVKDLVNEFDQFSNGLIMALEKIVGNSYWVKYVRIRVRQNMRSGCNSLIPLHAKADRIQPWKDLTGIRLCLIRLSMEKFLYWVIPLETILVTQQTFVLVKTS